MTRRLVLAIVAAGSLAATGSAGAVTVKETVRCSAHGWMTLHSLDEFGLRWDGSATGTCGEEPVTIELGGWSTDCPAGPGPKIVPGLSLYGSATIGSKTYTEDWRTLGEPVNTLQVAPALRFSVRAGDDAEPNGVAAITLPPDRPCPWLDQVPADYNWTQSL